jgi:membrane peptidoglycan carboxypeptidase
VKTQLRPEQLIERTVFAGPVSFPRELKLAPLALVTEEQFSKSQILEMYLNADYYGRGAYGIGAAASTYFGERPQQLDVAQAAFLAALVQAPSVFGAHPFSARMQYRWRQVIDNLAAQGYISVGQRQQALRAGIPVVH